MLSWWKVPRKVRHFSSINIPVYVCTTVMMMLTGRSCAKISTGRASSCGLPLHRPVSKLCTGTVRETPYFLATWKLCSVVDEGNRGCAWSAHWNRRKTGEIGIQAGWGKLSNHGSQQKLKMKFESKQATCKPRKENVMEESICQRTTMQRVQGRKLTILWSSFQQKQIVDHQALQIYSLEI